ncbi:hypothetical protein PMAYCL1PPCAC_14002, partial [Pristionchus mayeri]
DLRVLQSIFRLPRFCRFPSIRREFDHSQEFRTKLHSKSAGITRSGTSSLLRIRGKHRGSINSFSDVRSY